MVSKLRLVVGVWAAAMLVGLVVGLIVKAFL